MVGIPPINMVIRGMVFLLLYPDPSSFFERNLMIIHVYQSFFFRSTIFSRQQRGSHKLGHSCHNFGNQPRTTWRRNNFEPYPICSMYGIFSYMYPLNVPNVGKYSIHGAYEHFDIISTFFLTCKIASCPFWDF